MKFRTWIAIAAFAALLAAIPSSAGAASKPKHRLAAFGSCSRFVHYARRHALNELKTRGVPAPVGIPQPVRAPMPMSQDGNQVVMPEAAPTPTSGAGQDFSNTNNQEAGVDEPDSVKTDGKTVFLAQNGRIYAVDARSNPPKLLGTLDLGATYGDQILLSGDRLLVMSGQPIYYDVIVSPPRPVTITDPGAPAAQAAIAPPLPVQASTLTLVDVSKPDAMKVLRTMSVNGGFLNARMTGHTARVIFSATPTAIPVVQTLAVDDQRPKINRTTTPDWRPTYKLRRGTKGKIARHALVRCTSITRPEIFSGLNSLTVLTIDIEKGLDPVDSDAVMTDGQTVYASQKSLYIATQKAILEQPNSEKPPPEQLTEIHKFDISKPDETTYEGTGVVAGTLLNQYSMSEQDGFLRVASTRSPLWWSPGNNTPSESFVTVLEQDGNVLQQVGRVGEIGKGERIYAVRFIGDVGYVVTFRQIDPLYTVGLSDPEHPRVLGSLDLLGYSAYLHPVGDGLLLGVGQAANEQGRTEGTQVSLFDVSDPAKPTRLANKLVGNGSSSDAEFDPHAFLWWDPLKLAVLPVQIYDYSNDGGPGNTFIGAIGFKATKADGVTEAGRASHPADQYGLSQAVTRSLVVGQRLFTVSATGVLASDLATFADRGFVKLPVPAPSPPTPQPETVSSPPNAGSGSASR